ncbi:MAG: hypothetical protein ACFB2W_06580 [Leptolyngbyaceae cyanobacterium]
MSDISKIYGSYGEALNFSRDKFDHLYTSRARNASDFYRSFFHDLICPFQPHFTDPASLRTLHRHIERFFGTRQLDFVAIDGTCAKDPFQDFIVFSACAYGAKGQINLDDDPPSVRYQKWSLDKDVSMVTYIPVPFSEFADVVDQDRPETFLVSDNERVDLSNIDTKMMELAEIYLAYNVATSSALEAPKVILLDRSPSSILAGVALQPEAIPMLNYPFDRRHLTVDDATVALAHPFNPDLGIPTLKHFSQYMAIIAEFHHQRTQRLDLDDFASRHQLKPDDLHNAIRYLTKPRRQGPHTLPPFAQLDRTQGNHLTTQVNCRTSWDYCVSLFEHLCRRLFVEKDQKALVYESPDEYGVVRQRWMSPSDVGFLVAVGIRALIETCWERNILLTGIIKDSASRYLTRNYLGVMKQLGTQGYPDLHHLDVRQLPWTDRIFLELIPLADDTLEAPWSSIEFDSTYMTLHARANADDEPQISGVQGFIVSPERLFARSLAQFFLKRTKPTPLMGHVVFVDRLLYPEWDLPALDEVTIRTDTLGKVSPFCQRTRSGPDSAPNLAQFINMYLLNILTRNHFPEVIGYPDPLHKADWGAKTVAKRIQGIVRSSAYSFRSQPLSRTFRTIRDSFRRS